MGVAALRAWQRAVAPVLIALVLFGVARAATLRHASLGASPRDSGSVRTVVGDLGTASDVTPFELEGTRIRVREADGRLASDDEIIGAVLVAREGGGVRRAFRIDGAEVDPTDPSGDIVLYVLSTQDPATGAWANACSADPRGLAKGFLIAGIWDATGQHVRAPGQFEVTCAGATYGKCVRWGYKPWKSQRMWDLHQACTRMVRADYCGDGVGHTRNGTPIDVYDVDGVQAPDATATLAFEAGWGTDGAVCVRKTRLLDLFTLDAVRASCGAKLEGRLGEACSEPAARRDPRTLLLDKS